MADPHAAARHIICDQVTDKIISRISNAESVSLQHIIFAEVEALLIRLNYKDLHAKALVEPVTVHDLLLGGWFRVHSTDPHEWMHQLAGSDCHDFNAAVELYQKGVRYDRSRNRTG